MSHTELTSDVERRLRDVLQHVTQDDLIRLRQLLPECIQMTDRALPVPQTTFSFQSNVTATWNNRPVEERLESMRRLRESLTSVSKHELDILRQLLPQYIQLPPEENANSNEVHREQSSRPSTARCYSRSRSPEVVNRSFVSRCSVKCSASGCNAPCGKPNFAAGPPSHLRHLCQMHRGMYCADLFLPERRTNVHVSPVSPSRIAWFSSFRQSFALAT